MHKVGRNRFRAVLTNHRRNLAAVVGSMVCKMLQRLPERIGVHPKVERLVFKDAIEFRLRQAVNKVEQRFCLRRPMFAKRANGLYIREIRNRRMRASVKPFEPDPFCAANVHQGVAHGRKARAERLNELFVGELSRSVQRAMVRPIVILE